MSVTYDPAPMSHYNTYGPSWYDAVDYGRCNQVHVYHHWAAREILRSKVQTVLDVGCGRGTLARLLGSGTPRVLGVDFSRGAIGDQPGPTTCMFAEEIDKLGSGTYEAVACLEVLEHTDDPCVVWKKCKQVASRYVIVTVPPMMASEPHKWVEPVEWWRDTLGVGDPQFYDGIQAGWIVDV